MTPGSDSVSHPTETTAPVTATPCHYPAPIASGGTNGIAEPTNGIVSSTDVSSKQAIPPLWEEL